MVKKLSKKDTFGDSIDEVIGICTETHLRFWKTFTNSAEKAAKLASLDATGATGYVIVSSPKAGS
ncbi:hypothetical protein ACS0TY_027234 [Phlomoides rotata]